MWINRRHVHRSGNRRSRLRSSRKGQYYLFSLPDGGEPPPTVTPTQPGLNAFVGGSVGVAAIATSPALLSW